LAHPNTNISFANDMQGIYETLFNSTVSSFSVLCLHDTFC
jgi:hypothetical protein